MILLPPIEQIQAHMERKALTLANFARGMGYEPAAHHQLLCDALQSIADTGDKRIIFVLPPGSAKSTYASLLFPAYYMARHPRKRIILASYNGDMATSWGERTRDLVKQDEFQGMFPGVLPGKTAAGDWSLTNGSNFRAAGVGTSTTGRRADLLVIDDPIKDWEDAKSAVIREKHKFWWHSTAQTRLTPNASVILLQTRWHEDDLAGYLIASEPDRWEVIHIPMECVSAETDLLGRQVGDRLWPEYFTAQMVADAKRNPLVWENLYQGNPVPKEGTMFKVGLIEIIEPTDVPDKLDTFMAHDLAATEGGGDWTAVCSACRDQHQVYLDITRFQEEPFKRNKRLVNIAKAKSPTRYVCPQDPGSAGKESAQYIQRELINAGVGGAKIKPITGDKAARAEPLAAAVNAGMVKLVRSRNSAAFIEELRAFPNGTHDDMVDAAADAYNEMVLAGGGIIRQTSRRAEEEE